MIHCFVYEPNQSNAKLTTHTPTVQILSTIINIKNNQTPFTSNNNYHQLVKSFCVQTVKKWSFIHNNPQCVMFAGDYTVLQQPILFYNIVHSHKIICIVVWSTFIHHNIVYTLVDYHFSIALSTLLPATSAILSIQHIMIVIFVMIMLYDEYIMVSCFLRCRTINLI